MKILAGIVTHNRFLLLERGVDHVVAQSGPADRLLVIINGCTDDTADMLERKGVDFVTQANVGSAGGWKRAMQEALAGGWDAVWLMDDDGYPAPQALEVLERNLTPETACISSIVLREDEPGTFVFPFPVLDEAGLPVLIARSRKLKRLDQLERAARNDTYPFAHLFNGALIPTEVIRRIGDVNSDFFLMGDEVDYFMRMRAVGKVVSHLGARHLHPDVSRRRLDPAKLYYYVKNSIILNHRYFNKALARDLMTVAAALGRTARRNSLVEALSYVGGRRAPVLWRAVSRGLKGRIGPDFVG
jgi:rhamnopyranosyl-N-acetylglucosaminyl-diphospho-decaprenol beta-1,3/1,4-galactofuranosyltransferase